MKNIQVKIILIYIITGIVICTGMQIVLNRQLALLNASDIGIAKFASNMNIAIFLFSIIYLISIFIVIIILSRIVIVPMNRLIKSAQKIAKSDTDKLNKLKDIKKYKNKDNTKISDVFTIVTDELNKKLSEVETQKNQIEAILQHMTDGLVAFDKSGQIILINPEAKSLLDVSPEDDTFDDIFAKISDAQLEKVVYLDNWTSSNEMVKVNNIYLNLCFAPFKDEENRPSGVICVVQNITEHVKLNEMRKEFVADVSHELKTPLTTIMGYSETLLSDDYSQEIQTKFLSMILSEAQRMARLVSDLLTLSKYEQESMETTKEEFDLGVLVKDATQKLSYEANKKEHVVNCLITANLPFAFANKDDIERVYLNILSNAIKYTKPKGKINVYVGFVNNHTYIKVYDNGIGIPKESLDKIFERFYRVDKSRTRQMGGTGLGLSIAKEILDKNSGQIDIKSNIGEGTQVTIQIPTKNVKIN